MKSKKIIAALCALAVVVSSSGGLPFSGVRVFDTAISVSAAPSGTSISSLPTSAGTYYLAQDIEITSTWDVPSGTTTLDLNGHNITAKNLDSAITVNSGADLTLSGNGTISYSSDGNDKDAIRINGGTLTVDGATIESKQVSSGHPNGITMSGGILNFNNGSITLNGSGTVLNVSNGSIANLYNGTFKPDSWLFAYAYGSTSAINIFDGIFKKGSNNTLMNTGSSAKISLSGGYFPIDITSINSYIAKGHQLVDSDDTAKGEKMVAPCTYAVTLDNQGATTSGATGVTATYGKTLPSIEDNLPIKTNSKFDGYFSEPNGKGTKYLNADGTATIATWTTDGTGTLYAQWVEAHTHSFSYTASGSTITASCAGDCDITDGLTMTISAPTDLEYDGNPKEATLSTDYNTTAFPDTYTIEYYKGEKKLDGAPSAGGHYTAKVTVGEATASVDFTIVVDPAYTITIPAAVNLKSSDPVNITAEGVELNEGQKIIVTLDSATYTKSGSEFSAKDKSGKSVVKYKINDGAIGLDDANKTVAEFTEGGSAELSFAVTDESGIKFAGAHTETLTFGVSVEDAVTAPTLAGVTLTDGMIIEPHCTVGGEDNWVQFKYVADDNKFVPNFNTYSDAYSKSGGSIMQSLAEQWAYSTFEYHETPDGNFYLTQTDNTVHLRADDGINMLVIDLQLDFDNMTYTQSYKQWYKTVSGSFTSIKIGDTTITASQMTAN